MTYDRETLRLDYRNTWLSEMEARKYLERTGLGSQRKVVRVYLSLIP